MKELLSQKILQLKPSGIRKFFDVANEVPGVISLGVGEPDFPNAFSHPGGRNPGNAVR